MLRLLALLFLCALPARAQQGAEDGIGVQDGKGNFYSVTNRRSQRAYFQITKLTFSGSVLWNVPYTPDTDASATALSVDGDGNLVIAGTLRHGPHNDLLLVKFTPFGALMWRQVHEAGGNAVPTSTAIDRDGNIYAAATVTEPAGSRLHMVRYGPMGAFFWGHDYRGGRTNYARYVSIDPNGDARVTVETGSGDLNRGFAQSRQVLFTTYGAVVQQ